MVAKLEIEPEFSDCQTLPFAWNHMVLGPQLVYEGVWPLPSLHQGSALNAGRLLPDFTQLSPIPPRPQILAVFPLYLAKAPAPGVLAQWAEMVSGLQDRTLRRQGGKEAVLESGGQMGPERPFSLS